MPSMDGRFVMILVLAITSIPGVQIVHMDQQYQSLFWYPPLKAPNIPPEDSYSSRTRNNVNEESSAVRNTQLKSGVLIIPNRADYDASELDDSQGQETQTADEKDPDLSFYKKYSARQTLMNHGDEEFDLKNSIRQTMTNSDDNSAVNDYDKNLNRQNPPNAENPAGQYDPELNFFKDDSKHQTLSKPDQEKPLIGDSSKESARQNSPDQNSYRKNLARNPGIVAPSSDGYIKESTHSNPLNADQYDSDLNVFKKYSKRQSISNRNDVDRPSSKETNRQSSPNAGNTENLYKLDDDHVEKHKKRQLDTTPDQHDYEVVEEDYVDSKTPSFIELLLPAKELKVKRDELPPAEYTKISDILDSELSKMLESNDSNPCGNCTILKMENKELKQEIAIEEDSRNLMPAYPCDRWFLSNRTCWLDRNIGDTVTFLLTFGSGPRDAQVQWRQEFHILKSNKRRIYPINTAKPMWNVVIGRHGHEFRLSPITETDIDSNSFSAVVITSETQAMSALVHHKVNFRIKVIPIDQGLIYTGEILTLNMRRLTLPKKAIRFKWFMEKDGEKSTLPSNMKLAHAGEMLIISELRHGQGGVIACSVFTNLGFFATKQRYLINVSSSLPDQFQSTPVPDANARKRRGLDEIGTEIVNGLYSETNEDPKDLYYNHYQTEKREGNRNARYSGNQYSGTNGNPVDLYYNSDLIQKPEGNENARYSGNQYSGTNGNPVDLYYNSDPKKPEGNENARYSGNQYSGTNGNPVDLYYNSDPIQKPEGNENARYSDTFVLPEAQGIYYARKTPETNQKTQVANGNPIDLYYNNGQTQTSEGNGNARYSDTFVLPEAQGIYYVRKTPETNPKTQEANVNLMDLYYNNDQKQKSEGNGNARYSDTFVLPEAQGIYYARKTPETNPKTQEANVNLMDLYYNNDQKQKSEGNGNARYSDTFVLPEAQGIYYARKTPETNPKTQEANVNLMDLYYNNDQTQKSEGNGNARYSDTYVLPEAQGIYYARKTPETNQKTQEETVRTSNQPNSYQQSNYTKSTGNEPPATTRERIPSEESFRNRLPLQNDVSNSEKTETSNTRTNNIRLNIFGNEDLKTNLHIPKTKSTTQLSLRVDPKKKISTLVDEKSNFGISNIGKNNIGPSRHGNENSKVSANVPKTEPTNNRYPQKEFPSKIVQPKEKARNSETINLDISRLRNSNFRYRNPKISSNVQGMGLTRNNYRLQDSTGSMNGPNTYERVSNINRNKNQNVASEVNIRLEISDAMPDDSISKLMASCTSNLHCAPAAYCVKGFWFCRCRFGFQGNGIFCWAEVHLRSTETKRKRPSVRRQF